MQICVSKTASYHTYQAKGAAFDSYFDDQGDLDPYLVLQSMEMTTGAITIELTAKERNYEFTQRRGENKIEVSALAFGWGSGNAGSGDIFTATLHVAEGERLDFQPLEWLQLGILDELETYGYEEHHDDAAFAKAKQQVEGNPKKLYRFP